MDQYRLPWANDNAPFTLYNKSQRRFTDPTADQFRWMLEAYNLTKVSCAFPYLTCTTSTPPSPLPLTIGGMPAIFCPPDQEDISFIGDIEYANPRIADPCPLITWPPGTFPSKSQMTTTITALETIASIRKVHFLRTVLVVELEYEDGRIYLPRSLPGIVAQKGTTYHHDSNSLFGKMRECKKESVRVHLCRQFQARPEQQLAGFQNTGAESGWYTVDGMNTGLLSLFYHSKSMEKPVRPPSHSPVPVIRWLHRSTLRVLGSSDRDLTEQVCGAPVVSVDNGEVIGFCYRATASWIECAGLNDLIAEG